MYDASKKTVWYGKLTTAKMSTVVIFDPKLPIPEEGQIYLFNTSRNEIVRYVEDIVRLKLSDLTDSEIKDAKSLFGKGWRSARTAFLQDQPRKIFSRQKLSESPTDVDIDVDSDSDDESFDDTEDLTQAEAERPAV